MIIGGFFTRYNLKDRYHPLIVERMLDTLNDAPVSDLIDELLGRMSQDEIDNWAKKIQEEYSYSDELNNIR